MFGNLLGYVWFLMLCIVELPEIFMLEEDEE
jgi:hypothetical protein